MVYTWCAGEVGAAASAGVTPAWCHCRWTDDSIINFIAWAPGKPRPLGKDKKCVYMTASRGKGEVGAEGPEAEERVDVGGREANPGKGYPSLPFSLFPQLKKGQTREGRTLPHSPAATQDLSSELGPEPRPCLLSGHETRMLPTLP